MSAFLRSRTSGTNQQPQSLGERADVLYARQQDTLRQVRRGLADVAAARTRAELRTQQAAALMHRLQQEAGQALSAGNEDLAREALGRRASLHRTVTDLARQHGALCEQEDAITRSLQALQSQVTGIRVRKEYLDATRKAAEARTIAARSLSGLSGDLAGLDQVLDQAERETAALQAAAAGFEELLALTPQVTGRGTSNADAEFERLRVEDEVEQELALRASPASASPDRSLPFRQQP